MSKHMGKEDASKWILFNFQMSPEMKYMIEDQAFKLKITQSQLVRSATEEFLANHAETEQEKEFAELVMRQRRERLGLMKPKDGYKSEMVIFGAWQTIEKARKELERLGILDAEDFDAWIKRLEENKISIDPENPERSRIQRKFNLLITRLLREKTLWEKNTKLELALHEEEPEYKV